MFVFKTAIICALAYWACTFPYFPSPSKVRSCKDNSLTIGIIPAVSAHFNGTFVTEMIIPVDVVFANETLVIDCESGLEVQKKKYRFDLLTSPHPFLPLFHFPSHPFSLLDPCPALPSP